MNLSETFSGKNVFEIPQNGNGYNPTDDFLNEHFPPQARISNPAVKMHLRGMEGMFQWIGGKYGSGNNGERILAVAVSETTSALKWFIKHEFTGCYIQYPDDSEKIPEIAFLVNGKVINPLEETPEKNYSNFQLKLV